MQTPVSPGLSLLTLVTGQAVQASQRGWWETFGPALVGTLVGALIATGVQWWLASGNRAASRADAKENREANQRVADENRAANREERQRAHLEKALMDVLAATRRAEVWQQGKLPPTLEERKLLLHSASQDVADSIRLAEGWATRCDELALAGALSHGRRSIPLTPNINDLQELELFALGLDAVAAVVIDWVKDPDALEKDRSEPGIAREMHGVSRWTEAHEELKERWREVRKE